MTMKAELEVHALKQISGLRVLVIGDIMLDHYVWGDVTRISPEAPVPVVSVFEDSHTVGGAANVARNLKSLGVKAKLSGSLGKDEAAVTLREILDQDGVCVDDVWSHESIRTILKTRVVVQKQQLCRIDREDAPLQYVIPPVELEKLLSKVIRDVDAIIVSDYAKGVVDESSWKIVHRYASETKTFLALDPKPRRQLEFDSPDLLTPNRTEALELAGIKVDAHEAFPAESVCNAIWQKYHPVNLVVTLGADGMLVSREGKVNTVIPTVAQEVFDVSGAGDTVIATLTAALATGVDLETAAHLANAAAGVVVGKVGTATVSSDELLGVLEITD